MQASGMAPDCMQVDDIDLGLRSYNVDHDWSEGLQHHPSVYDRIRFTHTLGHSTQEERLAIDPDFSVTVLSEQQQKALDLVLQSLRAHSTIRLIISGGAGTDKLTLINAIVRSTREMFGNNKAVRVMGPTGVAAFNIGGTTVHHELAITADRNQSYKKLETQRCTHMQVDFKDTRLIIIDEYIMIGRKMLGNINLRCRDIFANNEPFGNVSIVLVGDIRQLLPAFDTPLYAEGGQELQLTGSSLTRCLNIVFVLKRYSDNQVSNN
ncbi:hypothetical protein MKW94_023326 [Papaver nudicaule]|uniref:ATP-dependent DNA helicase n=1 Tax=Papaver nudicaule TaxID=74823 RepID=A0AA41VZQ3_PAPNU|nr:hypothetical protein [Papaver nudicaule]